MGTLAFSKLNFEPYFNRIKFFSDIADIQNDKTLFSWSLELGKIEALRVSYWVIRSLKNMTSVAPFTLAAIAEIFQLMTINAVNPSLIYARVSPKLNSKA